MFARYAYPQGATPANILADVCAILCGTTDKATLSAACDQTLTEIHFSLNPATWVMHDNAATATGKVLKQRAADDSCDKFLHLATTGNGDFTHGISETWNATTHVGTNNGYNGSSAFDSSQILVASGSFSPSSAPGFILIYSDKYLTHISFKSASWSSTNYSSCVEFSRSGPLMAGNKYPNWGIGDASAWNCIHRPRAKHLTSAGDCNCSSKTSGVGASLLFYGSGSIQPGMSFRNFLGVNEETIHNLQAVKDFSWHTSAMGYNAYLYDFLGYCLSDALLIPNESPGSGFDEYVVDGTTYVRDGYPCYTFGFYSLCLLFPKG